MLLFGYLPVSLIFLITFDSLQSQFEMMETCQTSQRTLVTHRGETWIG